MRFLVPLSISSIVIFSLLLSPIIFTDSYGHGGGIDLAPPISFEGMNVTVSTRMSPQDLSIDTVEQPKIQIRFFDMITNQTLTDVTYRVEVWKFKDLLARDLFFSEDGILNIDVRPVYDCSEAQKWKCTKYFGERDSISGGLIERGEQSPIIQGPIFDKGGLYHIKVNVEGATSRTTFVDKELSFDTFVSVAQEQIFYITVPKELIKS